MAWVGCEIGSKFPKDPAQPKQALALRDRQVCNAWFQHVHLTDCRDARITEFTAEKYCFLTGIKPGIFTVLGDNDIDFCTDV